MIEGLYFRLVNYLFVEAAHYKYSAWDTHVAKRIKTAGSVKYDVLKCKKNACKYDATCFIFLFDLCSFSVAHEYLIKRVKQRASTCDPLWQCCSIRKFIATIRFLLTWIKKNHFNNLMYHYCIQVMNATKAWVGPTIQKTFLANKIVLESARDTKEHIYRYL